MQRIVGMCVAVTLPLACRSIGRAEATGPAPASAPAASLQPAPPPPAPFTYEPPAVPPRPTPFPPLGAEQPVGPVVYLRADNPRTTLQVQLDPDLWRDVCIVPCARSLDPSRTYRVTGRRFVPTDPFTLPRSSGQVTIDAKMGSRKEKTAGKVMVPVGVALAITGAIVFLHESRKSASENALTTDRNGLTAYGALGIVAGLGLSLAGLLFWHRNSSTVEMN